MSGARDEATETSEPADTAPDVVPAKNLGPKILDVVSGRGMRGTELLRFIIGWVAVVAAVITALAVGWGAWDYLPDERDKLKNLVLPFLALWTVVPPIFFWFDNFVLWHLEKGCNSSQFADLSEFKHGQELSRNLWLAIVAILAAIYASK